MDPNKIILDIETHPLIVAVVFFLIAFFGYNAFKKKGTTGGVVASTGTPAVLPTMYETYNQAYNSYPTGYTGTVIPPGPLPIPVPPVVPPVVAPPVIVPPKKECHPGVNYGLVPSGAWTGPDPTHLTADSKMLWAGQIYHLWTGTDGRTWGKSSNGVQVLMYSRPEYYPGGSMYDCR